MVESTQATQSTSDKFPRKEFLTEASALANTLNDQEFCTSVQQMIKDCEKNEALKRVEAFQLLQAQVIELMRRKDIAQIVRQVMDLCFDNLDHPLTTVAAIAKNMMRKVLTGLEDKEAQSDLINHLHSRAQDKGGFKSRFLALNLMVDFIDDPYAYLEKHPDLIKEVIESTQDTQSNGKYVMNFFEAFLKKALSRKGKEQDAEKRWFDIWINEYLRALRSSNDSLRDATCSIITPIVIKVNKNSLPLILASLHTQSDPSSHSYTQQPLEQLLTLLRIARQNKLLLIDSPETCSVPMIRLEPSCLAPLKAAGLPDQFGLPQVELLHLVKSKEQVALVAMEIIACEVKASLSVSKFEIDMLREFVRHGLRTTFPEYRQKFMKAVRNFMIRLRISCEKDVKKYLAEATAQPSAQLQNLIELIKDLLVFIQDQLYLDKPVEMALPLFELMRSIFELFGDFDYKVRVSQIFGPIKLVTSQKVGYFDKENPDSNVSHDRRSLCIFLLNSLKSTWAQVRLHAYAILTLFPDDYELFNDAKFVNEIILGTAQELSNNPKAMMAEASALFHKLLFKKCLKHLQVIPESSKISQSQMQLAFLSYVNTQLMNRVSTFQTALIKEGRKDALLHGYLSFFKHLFDDFKVECTSETNREEFLQWRQVVRSLLMETSLGIGQVCKGLLSNNGLIMGEGEEAIQVDCRGHPIASGVVDVGEMIDDYENFILVGVWLAVKENGIAQLNMLKCLDFPASRQDDTKLLIDADIEKLQDQFLDLLFNFKHRGAIEKAAETFHLFCVKLLESSDPYYKSLPGKMLDKALEKITTESLSTVLRRSAGIPPTIIAILRAEPISQEPVLLNRSISFLLELARTADRDDSKIHALNIMRFIFQDSMLRHDIQQFITPAMILATDSFSSNNWSIRNSALMAFTALTKRLLGVLHIQEQDLSRTRGLSVWEFLSKYHELSEYFLVKLREGLATVKSQKEEKEKQDLVIFSILLLISRLIPSFQLVEFQTDTDKKEAIHKKSRDESIQEYITLIKGYSGNATYFVRKISAQALLPLIKFDNYVSTEIPSYFQELKDSLLQGKKLKQNEAHGLMVRINVFLTAYMQYRHVAIKQLGPGHHQDEEAHRQQEEALVTQCFEDFEKYLDQVQALYSKVTVALFVKTFTDLISNLPNYIPQEEVTQVYQHKQTI